ncbi:DUF4199 domain-containing protein [bacterium SCSIO 12643]|nr:DUF4199 domain-containing protein [bacterium SCSIO 12643]
MNIFAGTEKPKKDLKMLDKEFYIKNGLIYGVVNIVYMMVTYVMGIETMISFWNIGFSLVFSLAIMIFMGTQVRKARGGYMTLSEGFKSLMVIYALGTFLYLLFNHLLGTVIDPELPGKMAEATIEKTMSMMESFDVPEEVLEETYNEMGTVREDIHDNYTIGGFIQTYVTMVAMGTIGALIGAAITKKENPNPFHEDSINLHE